MILNAYSIYDLKACLYHPPFYMHTDAAASRALSDTVNDASTNISRHPADYVLYCVGTFNDASGSLEPISPRRHVADAASFVRLQSQPLFDFPQAAAAATSGGK
jgi:hypothetical protein